MIARHRESLRAILATLTATYERESRAVVRDRRRRGAVLVALIVLALAPYLLGLARLRAAEQSLGTTRTVWVVTRDLAAGESIATRDVRPHDIPPRFLPPRALGDVSPSLVATRAISRGEVLTRDSASDGLPTAVGAPAGWRLVAVSPRAPLPPLAAGDRVDVVADARVLVEGALVASVVDGGAVIAVPAEHAAIVATAAADGTATLTVAG